MEFLVGCLNKSLAGWLLGGGPVRATLQRKWPLGLFSRKTVMLTMFVLDVGDDAENEVKWCPTLPQLLMEMVVVLTKTSLHES